MSRDLKNRLYNYEVLPPDNTWNNIASALDQSLHANFPSKLYDLQVDPPSAAWQKIKLALEQPMPITQAERKKISLIPLLRYAVAAAIIGIVVVGVVWFTNTKRNDVIVKEHPPAKTNVTNTANTSQPNPQSKTTTPSSSQQKVEQIISRTDHKLMAKSGINPGHVMIAASLNELDNTPVQLAKSFSTSDLEKKYQQLEYSTRTISYDPSKLSDNSPYFIFINPDGYVIRLSKKLATMIDCLYHPVTDQNQDCKSRVKIWKEKMVQSPISPSPGNFFDILDMVKSLQENHP